MGGGWSNCGLNVDKSGFHASEGAVCHYTAYDGAGDFHNLAGAFVSAGATITALSGGCWLRVQAGFATQVLFGESGGSGSFGWFVYLASDGTIGIVASDDGSLKQWLSNAGQISLNTWTHLQLSYNAGTIVVKKNNVAVTQASSSAAASITRQDEFAIGARNTGATAEVVADGDVARIVIEEAVWDATAMTNVFNGSAPSGAYQWPAGNGTETAQGLAAMTENGDPTTTEISCSEFS